VKVEPVGEFELKGIRRPLAAYNVVGATSLERLEAGRPARNWTKLHTGNGVRGGYMSISTRLTELLKIEHPILLAPMDIVSDGRLAAAVSRAGGFGIIGGGYGDETWLTREMDAAGDARVGVGFITWSMAKRPRLLDLVLDRRPPAVMLSFGEVRPHGQTIKKQGRW
jgi:hypothetical protein